MDWHDWALIAAGVIGSGVAVIHGRLTQKLMVESLAGGVLSDERVPPIARKLVPPLLHFSTFNWFLGGLALIAAALWLGPQARLITGVLVGSSYLYGALMALQATRRLHPGWVLYVVALGLIAAGLSGSDG